MALLGQYKYVIDKTHPRANSEGAVYEHIIVAEKKLGRRLLPEEIVHHKDLNKLNNESSNLMIFATNADHSRFHKNGCNEELLTLNENGSYVCEEQKTKCIDCSKEITRGNIRCKSCKAIHSRKVERPTSNELCSLLDEVNGNFTKVGKLFGVSDNTIRKWCNFYGLPQKSGGYKK